MRGRTVSKILKFAAALVAITCSVLKWMNIFVSCEYWEILALSALIGGSSTPIDLNMWIDKINKKQEKRNA